MNQTGVAPISDDELVARFVVFSRWVRANGTVKPDAFLPPPDLHLSVTRHASLSTEELWSRGQRVARQRGLTLHGRADLMVGRIVEADLSIEPAAIEGNPEHAHVVGWPREKSAQKSLAQRIAAGSRFHGPI